MRISERTHPVILKIKESIFKDDHFHVSSKPFMESLFNLNALSKLLRPDIFKAEHNISFGLILNNDRACFIHYYRTLSNNEGDFIGIGSYLLTQSDIVSKQVYLKSKGEDFAVKRGSCLDTLTTLCVYLFKKYAEIETKYLPAKRKTEGVDCKYINDTNLSITHLDSKWFTTLVKSDAFKVRGHFRLQPCGEGLKDKKLIWINDFMKDGYTAPARKLKDEI